MMADRRLLDDDPRWAREDYRVSAHRAAAGAVGHIRWLVGCGRRDVSRWASTAAFRRALEAAGCRVDWIDWDAAHELTDDCRRTVARWIDAL